MLDKQLESLLNQARAAGMPDLCDMVYAFPQAASDLRKAIKASLERYEPRLRKVIVSQADSSEEPLTLRYEIRAELATEEGKTPIWIQTRIDEFGNIEVKS